MCVCVCVCACAVYVCVRTFSYFQIGARSQSQMATDLLIANTKRYMLYYKKVKQNKSYIGFTQLKFTLLAQSNNSQHELMHYLF